MMDFDSNGDSVQNVRKMYEREGPKSCCKQIFKLWRKGGGASWKNLIVILDELEETQLANELRDIFSLPNPRTTSDAQELPHSLVSSIDLQRGLEGKTTA